MSKPAQLKAAARPPVDEPPKAPLAIAAAIKALHAGEASTHQQQIALQWIVREAGGRIERKAVGHDSALTVAAFSVPSTKRPLRP